MAYLLLVDDDEDFAAAAATSLRADGHEVAIQLDTAGALVSLQERKPDLLVLDVMFPEDSSAGFGFARTVRRLGDEFTKLPILMLTAVNARFPFGFSERDIDEDWLPVTDFVEKPVDFDVLAQKVTDLLAGKRPGCDCGGSC